MKSALSVTIDQEVMLELDARVAKEGIKKAILVNELLKASLSIKPMIDDDKTIEKLKQELAERQTTATKANLEANKLQKLISEKQEKKKQKKVEEFGTVEEKHLKKALEKLRG